MAASDLAGFQLWNALDSGPASIALRGDTEADHDRRVIALDGDGDFVQFDVIDSIDRAAQLTMSFDYARDAANGANSPLAWNHRHVAVAARDDGLVLRLQTDAGFSRFVVEDLGLNDTDWHRITVSVDETRDRAVMVVDGVVVFDETGLGLQLEDNPDRDWRLGGTWNKNLEGQIGNFELTADFDAGAAALALEDGFLF